MQNRVIETWDDTVLLCGRDRATVIGTETLEECAKAMEEDEETEVNSTHRSRLWTRWIQCPIKGRKQKKMISLRLLA